MLITNIRHKLEKVNSKYRFFLFFILFQLNNIRFSAEPRNNLQATSIKIVWIWGFANTFLIFFEKNKTKSHFFEVFTLVYQYSKRFARYIWYSTDQTLETACPPGSGQKNGTGGGTWTHTYEVHQILSLARLPFRHSGTLW